MADKTLNTIIVLRNDKSTDWASSSVILREGELGVSYLDNGNVMVKAGDGVHTWSALPQVESVLESDMLLTHSFGKHIVPDGSYLNAGGANSTMSQWIAAALKETIEPVIVQPTSQLTASAVVENADPEVGAKITALKWTGTFDAGSYTIGTAVQSTNLTASDTSWAVSNNQDDQTASSMTGTFELSEDNYIQIDTDGFSTYATIGASVSLDASNAATPTNNLGESTTGIITEESAGAPWSKTAHVYVTGYRKPFWGVIAAAEGLKSPENFTSADVRALPHSATKAKGLPTSLSVPEGSEMVVFFAKAGTYSSLTATDDIGLHAGVTFTKVANACDVEGANGFTAAKYDLWYVNWGAGIGAAKQLTLKWS